MVAEPAFIVVGCDGAPGGDPALRFAVDEARLRDAQLILVVAYVLPVDPDVDEFDTPSSFFQLRARIMAEAALRRALKLPSSQPLPDHQVVTAEGDAARAILAHAQRAIMIVIGNHDRTLLQRLFKPATSRHLLHDSQVPVTIVPGPG